MSRVRIRQFSEHLHPNRVPIAIQRRKEELALIPEGAVEAAATYAGRFDQVVNRGRLVSPSPECRHRAVQNFVRSNCLTPAIAVKLEHSFSTTMTIVDFEE